MPVLFGLLILGSCVKQDEDVKSNTTDYTKINAQLDKYITSTTYDVSAPESGQLAVVTIGSDTLSVTDVAKKIVVPKSITPTVTYVENKNQLEKKDAYWQVVAFEDSKNGDYDYNDLVFHVKFQIKNGKFFMGINPIAYGASKVIDLGYKIYDNTTDVVLDSGYIADTRHALFLDAGNSFINTYKYQRHYNGYTYSIDRTFSGINTLTRLSIVWYIKVDGNVIIYALNKQNASTVDLFNAGGYPYSLVLSGINDGKKYKQGASGYVGHDWYQYPLETVNFFDTYDVAAWLAGDKYLDDCLLDASKVIPVNTAGTSDNMRLYEVAYPYVPVTSYAQ